MPFTAVQSRAPSIDAPTGVAALDPVARTTLARLRLVGAQCRVLARSGPAESCAILSVESENRADAVARVLLRLFSGEGGMPRLRLYQPGAPEVSFDESWLLAALSAAARDDIASLTFLLARRLPRHARRPVGRLFVALSQAPDARIGAAA